MNLRELMTIDEKLSAEARARIWTRLDERLGAEVRSGAAWRRWRWPVACAIATCAALAILFASPAARAPSARALVAPPDTTLESTLGAHTHATLVGPAQLEVLASTPDGDATTLRLVRGTFLASFEGGGHRSLRVLAPGAVVDVVGTLFAVEAKPDQTCVSVAHGRVRVTMGARVVFVSTGERVCTGAQTREPIDPYLRDELARHETVTAAAAPSPPPPPPPPPSPSPSPPKPPAKTTHVAATPGAVAVAVAVAAPAPAPAPVPLVSGEDLYRTAESALASHDPSAADLALAQLVAIDPPSALRDQALYERARIAYARHAWAEARRDLDALVAIDHSPLVEPGRYLACRVAVEARDADAARCLSDFRATYPQSAHDLDALGLLAQLAFSERGCAAAHTYIEELASRHPDAQLTTAWRKRCAP